MTWVLLALPVVLVLAWLAPRWFTAKKEPAKDFTLPRELP